MICNLSVVRVCAEGVRYGGTVGRKTIGADLDMGRDPCALKHAVALYFAWYNFVRVHGTLRVTPQYENFPATNDAPLFGILKEAR